MSGYLGTATAVVPGESRLLSVTISPAALGGGDSVSTATGSLSMAPGSPVIDANAANLILEPAAVSGSVVSQMLGTAWLPGAVYLWIVEVVTAEGQTPSWSVHIPVGQLL